jgi:hypothetical protein
MVYGPFLFKINEYIFNINVQIYLDISLFVPNVEVIQFKTENRIFRRI